MLSTYDRAISKYTQLEFGRSGIDCVLNTRVAAVRQGEVTLVNRRVALAHACSPPPAGVALRVGYAACTAA